MPVAHAHAVDPAPAAAHLDEIADGVYAWVQPDGTWWINNAGAIRGAAGMLVVDTCATAERTRRFLDTLVVATGNAPITHAVNTHEHGDHTYGNWLLPATTTLIGHANMRAVLADDEVIERCPPVWQPVPEWGADARRLPDVTITSDATVHLGDHVVEIHHPGGPAHTTGDLVAWLPDQRVLFTGDLLFAHLTPLVMAGSLDGAKRALTWIDRFEPAVVVPGHGPVVTASELADVLAVHDRYYSFVQRLANDVVRSGRGVLDVARSADLGEFATWDDAERVVLNLHRAVAEAGGPPFDLLAAFGDALDYNGGPFTTHVCCTR